MNQKETIIRAFEEKVANPEIQVTINVNPFVIVGQILESHTEGKINKYISHAAAIPEKVPVISVIFGVVRNINLWPVNKPADYMPVIRMVVIIFVMFVGIRIVVAVIISPAIVVPSVTFPISFPMFIIIVIIISTILFVAFIITSIFRRPVFFTAHVISAYAVS